MFGSNKKEKKESALAYQHEQSPPASSGSFNILKRPVVSEKALGLEARGEYIFGVADNTTKPEVKKEIERKYNVKVARVNMIVAKPRRKIFRGRAGYKSGFKKALVKLESGQKIEVLPK